MANDEQEVIVEQKYELSTNYGFIKRIFTGILLYFWYISGKALKMTITKKYRKVNKEINNADP